MALLGICLFGLFFIGEPITPNLLIGLVAVFAGIWIATGETKTTSD
ncbi:hypothetical protein [Bradyrhizobium sp. 186]|nr:hypothetical protein [Bradyrhizobium sp. 186]